MEFKLTYEGELPSEGNPAQKHRIRKALHPQLVQLWESDLMLKDIKERGADVLNYQERTTHSHAHYFQELADKCRNGTFRFLPLVTKDLDLVCSLEILILRREPPGDLVKAGGDIDNRIKTLFDALRVPRDANEIPPGAMPGPAEDPFYCLLEDDSLIVDFKVSADRLLAPPSPEESATDVRLLLNVKIKPTVVTIGNVGFF